MIIGNFLFQFSLGYILSKVLSLHVNSDFRGSREWIVQNFLTIPLLIPTSLAILGGAGHLGSTFHFSTVISIIPSATISIYILQQVMIYPVYSRVSSSKFLNLYR